MIFKRKFGKGNSNWDRFDPMYNEIYLHSQDIMFNQLLEHDRFLTLHDVLSRLGITEYSKGCFIFGWVAKRDPIVKWEFEQIDESGEFILTFDCDEIVSYFKSEGE